MKKSLYWAVPAAVVSLCLCYTIVIAQGPAGSRGGNYASGTNIAMVDISLIFKNHIGFKGKMEDMKAEVQRAETQIRNDQTELRKLVDRLQEFNKGTPDYRSLEEEVARRKADMDVKMHMQRNEFLQREASIYYTVYQEILQATDYYCKQNGVDLVMRFSSDQVKPQQPESVLAFINKDIVWYQTRLDITQMVLNDLNRGAVNPNANRQADQRGAASRPASPFNPPQSSNPGYPQSNYPQPNYPQSGNPTR